MSFITLSNAQRIIFKADLKDCNFNGGVYKKQIYFLGKHEIKKLLAIQEFFKNPELFFNEYYKPVQVKKDTKQYIFEGKAPSYHNTADCDRLCSDFTNFELPEEIKEKGSLVIEEFRVWFKQNMYLMDKPEIFIMRMQLRWGIKRSLNEIKMENSGVIEIENMSLLEIEQKIDELISKAGAMYYENSKSNAILKRFNRLTFLAEKEGPIENNDTGYSDKEVKELLRGYDKIIKQPIKKLLIEYYRIKLNPKLKIEQKILEQLGFKSCRKCCNEH